MRDTEAEENGERRIAGDHLFERNAAKRLGASPPQVHIHIRAKRR